MSLLNLKRFLKKHVGRAATDHPESPRGGTGEVEAVEGYLRDDLSDSLYQAASRWLQINGPDCTYVVGEARGNESFRRHAGVVELVRLKDGHMRLSAISLDSSGRRQEGATLSVELHPDLNVGSSIDIVKLAWLTKMLDPANGAHEIGASAYHLVESGTPADILDD